MSQQMMLVPKRPRASFRERVSRALEAVRSYTLSNLLASDPKTAHVLGFGAKTDAGIVVTARNAFTFSAVFDAVNQGSSDVAKLPLNLLKRKQGGGSEHYTDARLYRLLKDEPNPEMSSMDFRQCLQAHAMTRTGGFAEIERDGAGRPFWLWPITPDRVERKRDRFADGSYGPLYYLVDNKDAIPARDMLDIRGLGYDGSSGYDVIDKARQAIGLALAAEKFGASFFGSGAGFPGLLGIKTSIGPESMNKLREHVDQQYGPGSWNRFLIIDNDPSFTSFGTDPQKAQMNELRTKQVEEVARFFNFPVHKLKNLDRATNNNIEQQDLEYYKGFMLNWTTKWEQECNRKLIAPLESRQQFIKHNVNAFLRGDTAARTAFYTAMVDRGIFNADMVLELEDMNPQPNGLGQIYVMNSTFVPKHLLEDLAKARTTPPPAPKQEPDDPDADGGVTQEDVDQANDRARQAEHLAEEMRATAATAQQRVAELEGAAGATAEQIAAAQAKAAAEAQRANTAELLAAETRRNADTLQVQFEAAEAERARLAAEVEAERAARAADVARLEEAVAAETRRVEAAAVDLAREQALEQRLNETLDQQIALTQSEQTVRAEVERLQGELAAAHQLVTEAGAERQTLEQAHAAALEASTATISALEQQLREAQQAGSAESTRATELEAALNDARAGRVTLEQEQAAAETRQREAIAAAEQRAADLQAQADAATTRATELERALAAERSARQGQVAAEIAAHRALVVDIMRRMIERETERARRNQTTPDKLRTWLDAFYDGHADLMATALLPAIRIHLAWIGSATDNPLEVARRLAARHVDESRQQIRMVLDGDADELAVSLAGLWHRWETERATAIADHLMTIELDHVRAQPLVPAEALAVASERATQADPWKKRRVKKTVKRDAQNRIAEIIEEDE